jgi:hypothetical protein
VFDGPVVRHLMQLLGHSDQGRPRPRIRCRPRQRQALRRRALNSSVRSAIGFLALLNQTTAESSEKHREPTPIESSSLCKIAQ